MVRRRGENIEVYVPFSQQNLKYGFRTNKTLNAAYGGQLGQIIFAGEPGVFFGANSPKPNKATKEFEGSGTISSFCADSKINALQQALWKIRPGLSTVRGLKLSGKTRTVYVPMPGNYKYAWNITASEVDLGGILGFSQATQGDVAELVWGSYPKPPVARKINQQGRSTSTFIQPKLSIISAAAAQGWSVDNVNYDLIPDD